MNIAKAIRGKQRIRFNYDGQSCVVEPHALGMDKRGFQALRAYQVDGSARSATAKGWKLFHADQMRDVELLGETFPHAQQGYRRADSPFWSIYEEL